jgi:hypothetical protein
LKVLKYQKELVLELELQHFTEELMYGKIQTNSIPNDFLKKIAMAETLGVMRLSLWELEIGKLESFLRNNESVGLNFAQVEMQVFLVVLLQKFRLETANHEPETRGNLVVWQVDKLYLKIVPL